MELGSRERWGQRDAELKRRAWRWNAPGSWVSVAIGVGCLPVGIVLAAFPIGDTDRLGALMVAAIGLGTCLGLIAYLDREIDRREGMDRRFGRSSSDGRLRRDVSLPPPTRALGQSHIASADVRQVAFHQKLRGYSVNEVDAALETIAAALDTSSPLRRADIASMRFSSMLRGYDPKEVDDFLRRVLEATS